MCRDRLCIYQHFSKEFRMSNKKYDTLIYLGRFQPTHTAHAEIIHRATQLADQLIIIVGSANQPRTYKNPFTSAERESMLKTTINLHAERGCAVRIEHNVDTIYNDQAWTGRVQAIVAKHTATHKSIGIIGHKKDASTSAYLEMFPQWAFEPVELIEPLNATDVRDLYFRNDVNMKFIQGVVPATVFQFLDGFRNSHEYKEIIHEREFIQMYKQQFAGLAYPPTFITVDCCVIQSGHVLTVTRKSYPGKGLLALPGGFLNQNERIVDAAIRELKEETRIKVPVPVLKGSIKRSHVFDHPDRSLRGRTVTHAFLIELVDGPLEKVKGSDDALSAQWIPVGELDSALFFEDHAQMIQTFLGA